MERAREYQYLYVNPCEGVSLPEMEKKEAKLLTIQEQKKLEPTAKDDKHGLPILLAMYTGLRVGELCALKWSDVDMENGIISVTRTIQRVQCFSPDAETKTTLITDRAKSKNSARIVPLPARILQLLREQKKLSFCEYIFSCNGHFLEPRVLQYRFKVLLKKAGLQAMNFHALRHTFATRCMELCFDVKTLSEILGHSSAKMTLDIYSHSQIEHKRAAMQNLNKLFDYSA